MVQKKRHELKYHECPPLKSLFWIVREESVGLDNDKYWWVMKSTQANYSSKDCPYPKGIFCCPYCREPLDQDE